MQDSKLFTEKHVATLASMGIDPWINIAANFFNVHCAFIHDAEEMFGFMIKGVRKLILCATVCLFMPHLPFRTKPRTVPRP